MGQRTEIMTDLWEYCAGCLQPTLVSELTVKVQWVVAQRNLLYMPVARWERRVGLCPNCLEKDTQKTQAKWVFLAGLAALVYGGTLGAILGGCFALTGAGLVGYRFYQRRKNNKELVIWRKG